MLRNIILITALALSINQVNADVIPGSIGSPSTLPSGILGVTDGSTGTSSEIGFSLECTGLYTTLAFAERPLCTLLIPAGTWLLNGHMHLSADSNTRRLSVAIGDAVTGGWSVTDGTQLYSEYATANGTGSAFLSGVYANVSTPTTYYLMAYATSMSGGSLLRGSMKAVRIR